MANIFHVGSVILMMSVYSRAIAQEGGGNRDAQSQNAKRIDLSNNQTKTPNGVITFTLSLGTATSVFSMEDIDN